MPNLSSPRALLIEQLQEIYSAENQLIDALSLLPEAPSAPVLKSAFATCLRHTAERAELVADLVRELQECPANNHCRGIAGLIAEAREAIAANGDPCLKDFALLTAARKIEHFHLIEYAAARTLAEQIGEDAIAAALTLSLEEGARSNEWLSVLVEQMDLAKVAASADERSSPAWT